MLGTWRPHAEYQSYLIENILPIFASDRKRVAYYSDALSKLYILDLDPLKSLFEPVFSNTGKPSNQQPEILRSFILMSELGIHSIPDWVTKLKADALLCYMIGVDPKDVPGVGSHYDFIDRLWMENPDIEEKRQDSLHPFRRKPRKKLGKNQKQPPRHPGIIQKKVCNCVENKNYNCDCPRKFSDPEARHGWDSYHEEWFYDHCGYFLSVYNQEQKCDLPIYLRMVQAQRYDGVSAIVALAEARKLYPPVHL